MSNGNEAMNRFIRGERGADEPETGMISDKQEAQIKKYMASGASYQEARDLVLSFEPEPKPKLPEINAGAGRGSFLKSKVSMNDFIRAATGHLFLRR